jgi:G:T/U-mismatch repair DNA glycosylase
MKLVKHKFLDHQINPNTETFIIGTFNPDTDSNQAEFFYGRGRNYLWRLLPVAFQEADLQGANKLDKLEFITKNKIDFIDLISEVEVEEGQEANYYDGYIDKRKIKWREIISEIDQLKNLKRVCFTRKTFSDIQNMKKQIEVIKEHCKKKNIHFQEMITPARFYNEGKQIEWTNFILNGFE